MSTLWPVKSNLAMQNSIKLVNEWKLENSFFKAKNSIEQETKNKNDIMPFIYFLQ